MIHDRGSQWFKVIMLDIGSLRRDILRVRREAGGMEVASKPHKH